MMKGTPNLIDRRTLLLGAGLASTTTIGMAEASSALPVPPLGRLGFRIMRQGSRIGEHHSTFERKGDALTIRAEAEIIVRLMGISVFRYAHHATEQWQGGEFATLQTKTNDDGTSYWVDAERAGSGLVVSGSAQNRYVAPAEALPMTHWNRSQVRLPKINPQKGDLLRPAVIDRGIEQVAVASGGTIAARRYQFTGQAILDVWYDADGYWAALAFLGGDQSRITLERL